MGKKEKRKSDIHVNEAFYPLTYIFKFLKW